MELSVVLDHCVGCLSSPRTSPGSSIPVAVPKPNARAIVKSASAPTMSDTFAMTMLLETSIASRNEMIPCLCVSVIVFRFFPLGRRTVYDPCSALNFCARSTFFPSSAAEAVTTLNTDPGSNMSVTTRFLTVSGSVPDGSAGFI